MKINYWRDALQNLSEPYKKWLNEEANILKKYIKNGAKVLDIGCGDGRILKLLATRTKNQIGIDHDINVVKHAIKKIDDIPIKIIFGEGINLPFENESFDNVLCLGTFANLDYERLKVLNEMKRVLKKDGLMIISSYSEDALEERLKLYDKTGSRIKEKNENGKIIFEDGVDNISEQFSREQLESMFSEVGLKIKEIKKIGIGYVCVLLK